MPRTNNQLLFSLTEKGIEFDEYKNEKECAVPAVF